MNLYVLVGGQGRRLGQDKPNLPMGNDTILSRAVRVLHSCFEEILLVGGAATRAHQLGLPHLPDVGENGGPLGGLAASLLHAGGLPAFVMAGDMPFVSQKLVRSMLDCAHGMGEDALVPCHGGFVEPLFAVYRDTCLPAIRGLMDAGRRKVTAFYERIEWKPFPEQLVWDCGHPGVLFFNINTQADWDVARRLAGPHRRGVLRDGGEVPVLSITGWSGAGKTHMLSRLITAYSEGGLTVAAAKHAGGGFTLDHPSSDTARFASSGARAVTVVGPQSWALMDQMKVELAQAIHHLEDVDVVLAEGFTQEGWPQVEVVRDPSCLRTPTALGFVGRESVANGPFPFFTAEHIESLVQHVDLLLGIERGGEKRW